MEKKTILEFKGVLDVSSERGEAFISEFINVREGITDEVCYNLLEHLDEFDKRNIEIKITIN